MATTYAELVAERVRAQMGRRRISQHQLADKLGRSQSYVSRRCRGVDPLDVEELEAIAEALQVPIAELIPLPEAS
ncbi:MAG: helix-turn-helix domain-containing protein [Solirubrobacteraceae bacterium]